MSIGHYSGELGRLATEVRQTVKQPFDRVTSLWRLAAWIRSDLYPAVVAAAVAAGSTPPTAPPEA